MQLEEEGEFLLPMVRELIPHFNERALRPQQQRFLYQKMAYGRGIAQTQSRRALRVDLVGLPLPGPQLAMVRQIVAQQLSALIVGKQFIPPAAPGVVVGGVERLPGGSKRRVIPEK